MAVTKIKMTIRHADSLSGKNSEIFTCNPEKISANLDSQTAVAVDTFARAFTALSTDTYSDTEISQTVSINEILAEEG